MVDTLRPKSLAQGLKWLKETKAMPLAGGTDLMVHHRDYSGTSSKIDKPVLFTDAIKEIREIKVEKDYVEMGAACLLSELEFHTNVPELLRRSISQIAAPALRNRATMAGNICNASPAGDTLPPLYIYDAQLVISSLRGERVIPVADFITGPGKTVLAEDELLISIRIPHAGDERIFYRKVGTRAANALTKLSVAAIAKVSSGKVIDFRLAMGAVAPVIVRDAHVEKLLNGSTIGEIDINGILKAYEPLIRPIDDQRSSAKYRKTVTLNIIKDFLENLNGV